MWLTDRKYALSPGPSLPEPSLYFAYGGPHARVSSPRVGCSILTTSALILLGKLCSRCMVTRTQGLLISVYNTAITIVSYSSQLAI
jgi:hypothetical protein